MSERLLPTRRLGRLLETGASCFYDARGESDRVSIKALEQLCFDDPTSADALADVITVGNGEEVSPETAVLNH